MKYILFFVLFFFLGCVGASKQPIVEHPLGDSSRTSVDWSGVYEGIVPCADCEGIRVRLALTEEGFFELSQEYLGKSLEVFKDHGVFDWDKEGGKIVLQGLKERNVWFRVGENRVDILDKEKNIISSQAGSYTLQKRLAHIFITSQNIEEHYLHLLLSPIKRQNGKQRTPYLFLKRDEKRFYGFGGCNRLMGMYEIKEKQHIEFSKIVSTKMMCPQIHIEQNLFERLEKVETYSIENEIVTLYDHNKQAVERLKIISFD